MSIPLHCFGVEALISADRSLKKKKHDYIPLELSEIYFIFHCKLGEQPFSYSNCH